MESEPRLFVTVLKRERNCDQLGKWILTCEHVEKEKEVVGNKNNHKAKWFPFTLELSFLVLGTSLHEAKLLRDWISFQR